MLEIPGFIWEGLKYDKWENTLGDSIPWSLEPLTEMRHFQASDTCMQKDGKLFLECDISWVVISNMPKDSDKSFEYMEANPQCIVDAVRMTFWISDFIYPVEAREAEL